MLIDWDQSTVNVVKSVLWSATNVVPQSSILETVLSSGFTNCRDAGLKYRLSKFMNNAKFGDVNFLKGRETLKRNPDKFDDWAITNFLEFEIQKQMMTSASGIGQACIYVLFDSKLNRN